MPGWGPRLPRPRLLVVLAAASLLLGGVVVLPTPARTQATPARTQASTADRGRVAPDLPDDVPAGREAAVRALLAARGAAVRSRDRNAFLSTVDPQAPAFVARQAALFDALHGVPHAGWEYVLDATRERPADPALDRRHGPGWWAPGVSLRYRLAAYDDQPTVEEQALTLVPRADGWKVAADDDFQAVGAGTTRGLWDAGPVVAVRRPGVLVLGHPGNGRLLGEVARTVQAAVPRVSRFWGEDWSRRVVVLVPATQDELDSIVPGGGDLRPFAALATAEAAEAPGGLPVGNRVVVNPSSFLQLGTVGRRVVLTHEVSHVATRPATGPHVPAWLVEGLADHIGYLGTDVPVRIAARDLGEAVRAGRLPEALPPDSAFDGAAPALGQAYEQAWLAVSLLVERYGAKRVVELYRAAGRARTSAEVERALFAQLDTSSAAFTRDWRATLVRRLQ